ncbi:MAG: tetratricopeptide repeat protein [Bdellovibrionota bacterium]
MFIKTLVLLILCATSFEVTAQGTGTAVAPVANSGSISVGIEDMNDVAHFEFNGREIWDYKLTREADGIVSVEVDQLDDKSVIQLKTIKSKHIEKIEILPGVNLKNKIVFYLKDKSTQSFDYITDQPSRLVVDFFKDAPQKPAAVVQVKKVPAKIAKLPVKKGRAPAGTDFLISDTKKEITRVAPSVLDGADPNYTRFKIEDYEIKESAIIASKLNLYITYPMLLVEMHDLQDILATPNIYNFEKSETDEGKKAQLLLTLFKKGKTDPETQEKNPLEKPRNAVFLKTLDLFKKEYPDSKYKETLDFMEADTYYNLWVQDKKISDFDTAINLYTKILLSVKASKYHDRIERLMGYSHMDRADYLTAFTVFQKYINRNPDSEHKYRIKTAMAECLAKLNNTSDALKIYEEIESDPKAGINAAEAAFRKGDIYAITKQYDKAIAEYERALKKYSKEQDQYPNAFYNIAESKFWLNRNRENLKQSLNAYIEFLKKYPKSEHASYAMERIGETLEILGAPQKRYNGAFVETIYRYGNSQAAGIAKIRLLRAQIPSMKDKQVVEEVAKVNEFIKTSSLEKLTEFKTIMISDGYYADKNYDEALKNLIAFYQEHPLSDYLDVFKKRIVQTIKDQIGFSIAKGDYLKAFQIYGQNAGSWLKGADRIDTSYLLGVAFEKSGVPDEAQKKYQSVLNKLYAIRGTIEEKERGVFEELPSIDEVNLRLAAVFVAKNEYGKAQDHLKEISGKDATDDEKVEKVYLSSIVYEKLNNPEFAIRNLKELTETWRGNPEKLSSVYLRLAKLQSESNQNADAIGTLDRLLNMSTDSSVVTDEDQMLALRLKAEYAVAIKKDKTAIEAYRSLLDLFEDKYPLYSARYQLGKIHYDTGDVKEAEKVWSPLKDKSDAQLWDKLAQENLKSSNWNSEYKKYTNRIPAMVNDKAGSSPKEGNKK